jgi:hypothetical protein
MNFGRKIKNKTPAQGRLLKPKVGRRFWFGYLLIGLKKNRRLKGGGFGLIISVFFTAWIWRSLGWLCPFTNVNVSGPVHRRERCGAKPIERDDTYRSNVAPYRSLVILTLMLKYMVGAES